MSDKDTEEISKVHEVARGEARLDQDIAVQSSMSGENTASAYGRRGTGTQKASINKAAQGVDNGTKAFDLLLYLDALEKLDGQLQDILDKAQESLEHINDMQKLQEDWDFEQAKLFFSETYNLDISGMSESAAREFLTATMDQETLTYARYMREARNIERQMNAKLNDPDFLAASPEQQQAYRQHFMDTGLSRMAELNSKAEEMGVNVEGATGRLRKQNDYDSELFQGSDAAISTEEYEGYVSNTKAYDDTPFADLVPNLSKSFNEATQLSPIDDLSLKGKIQEQINNNTVTVNPGSF